MMKWKDISRLSDSEAQRREATFEAEMLALLNTGEPPRPTAAPAPAIPIQDGIRISVTQNGHTTHYSNLEAVPLVVQQRILKAWRLPSPAAESSPLSHKNQAPPLPVPRRRTIRFAMALNLLLPGAGQFYLGQPIIGSVYAIGFVACFSIILLKFFRAYFDYLQLSTNGDVLEPGKLEQLSHAFPAGTFAALTIVSVVIYLASSIHLALSHRRK